MEHVFHWNFTTMSGGYQCFRCGDKCRGRYQDCKTRLPTDPRELEQYGRRIYDIAGHHDNLTASQASFRQEFPDEDAMREVRNLQAKHRRAMKAAEDHKQDCEAHHQKREASRLAMIEANIWRVWL